MLVAVVRHGGGREILANVNADDRLIFTLTLNESLTFGLILSRLWPCILMFNGRILYGILLLLKAQCVHVEVTIESVTGRCSY